MIRRIKRRAGATPLRLSALFSSRAYTLPLSTAEELSHDHPARRLQLWAASPYDRRRIGAYLDVSLSGVPASYWPASSNQARFRPEQVTFTGKATTWSRTAESGNVVTFNFCPTCGSTVYWESESFPGYVIVAIGNFADPNFPAPTVSV